MAKKSYVIGVTDVKSGPIPAGGGMATELETVGETYKDSVTLEEEDGEVSKYFATGKRYPFLTLVNAGATTFKFGLPDMSPENLQKWCGGKVVKGQWQAPRGNFQASLSLDIITEFGVPIRIPKATCYGVRKFAAKAGEIGLINVTAIVELPESEAVSPIMIGEETSVVQASQTSEQEPIVQE